jgi:hypothetical protein
VLAGVAAVEPVADEQVVDVHRADSDGHVMASLAACAGANLVYQTCG